MSIGQERIFLLWAKVLWRKVLSLLPVSFTIFWSHLSKQVCFQLYHMRRQVSICYMGVAWTSLDSTDFRVKGTKIAYLLSVLGSSDLCISSENTVFLALMRWALVNEVFEDHLKPLLDLVHMKSMTINYLHDVVTSDHPIASTVPGFHGLFEEAVFFHAFSTVRWSGLGLTLSPWPVKLFLVINPPWYQCSH